MSLRLLALLALLLGLTMGWPVARAAGPGLAVSDAWMRAVLPSRPAAGYFTLSNGSAEERTLVGASTPACGSLMLHRSLHEGGQDRMEMVKSVVVPAHSSVKFQPGGYHLMCLSPSTEVAPGHAIAVTLHFADGAALETEFVVRGSHGEAKGKQGD